MHCRCICNLLFFFFYLFNICAYLTTIRCFMDSLPLLRIFLLLLYTTILILIIDDIHLLYFMYLGPIVGGHERGHRVDHPPAPPWGRSHHLRQGQHQLSRPLWSSQNVPAHSSKGKNKIITDFIYMFFMGTGRIYDISLYLSFSFSIFLSFSLFLT